jgi:predicted nucleic acid-binding protein
MMKIVFNSSPLIFLSRLNFLDLFLTNEAQFLLPESVKEEISAKQDQSSGHINTLIAENKLLVQKVKLVSLANSLSERLGIGESEAITLGIELQPDYIILDDFAARKEAVRLGLNVKGTLAVIRKLQLNGKINISDLDILYEQIRNVNFRVKREIFDSIFED